MRKLSKIRMVIMAHPDDPELSCGGCIALWAENDDIYFVLVTSGEKGKNSKGESTFDTALKREKEAKKAADFLNVKKVIFMHHSDGEIGNTGTLKLEIAALIRKIKPDIVITHDPWSHYFHPDHRSTAFTVIKAIMIARDSSFYPSLLEIGLKPHAPAELLLIPTENPNFVVDISGKIDDKIKAIKMHKSQLVGWERYEDYIRGRAKREGMEKGYKFAESFFKMVL